MLVNKGDYKRNHAANRFLQIGFVAMFVMTMGTLLFILMRPADGTKIEATVGGYSMDQLVDALYPVGSVYTSTDSTNPGDKFGGSWAAYGSGKTLVGVDSGDSDFASGGKTGGEKAHTLTIAEMPSHRHSTPVSVVFNGNAAMHRSVFATNSDFWTKEDPHNATSAVGGDRAHNNLQPYVTVYFWERTS